MKKCMPSQQLILSFVFRIVEANTSANNGWMIPFPGICDIPQSTYIFFFFFFLYTLQIINKIK